MSRRPKEVRVGLTKRPTVNSNVIDQNTQNKRLKPLYGSHNTAVVDAIDAGHCRNAIDIADKMVRKFGTKDRGNVNDRVTVTTAKALKALAFIRTDNSSEATGIIEAAEEAMLTDEFNEGTLQVLFHCHKESYVLNRIPLLLEKVLRVRVATENMLNELYMGYARICDYKNQQRVANMLYKDHENAKYLLWSATSTVMQALTSPSLADKICFPLAQRMLEKAMASKKCTRAEIQLYFTVLWKRGDAEKALKFLADAKERDAGKDPAISDSEYNQLVIEALTNTNNLTQLASFAEDMLKKEINNWTLWKALLLCLDAHMSDGHREDAARILTTISSLLTHAKQQQGPEKFTKHDKMLVKNMTLLHIVKSGFAKREELQQLSYNLGSCVENCKTIISEMYSRPYCFKDISAFFPLLNVANKKALAEHLDMEPLKSQIFEEHLSHPYLLREQLRVVAGLHNSANLDERRDYVLRLLDLLDRVEDTDVNIEDYAKAVVILVANIYWQLYADQASSDALYELALTLELIYDRYSNVYIAGLLLMRIYSILGDMQRMMSLFNRLDIKYIQRDSLGYLTFTSAMQFGRFKDAIYYYTSLTTQFDQNERETSESIVVANRVCSLDKIPQLAGFLDRCRNSVHARGADVLNQMLSACFAIPNLNLALITLCGDEDRVAWHELYDPRDFDAIECFTLREKRPLDDIRRLSFNETCDYIKLHHLLGRALGDMGKADLKKLTFDADHAALRQHFDYCKATYTTSKCSESLAGFSTPALVSLVQLPVLQPLLVLLDVCAAMMDVQSRQSSATIFELLAVVAPVLQTPNWSLMLAGVSLRNAAGDEGDALEIATFIAHCAQALMSMTLAAMLLRFMEARAEKLVTTMRAQTTSDKLANTSVSDEATSTTRTDISVDDDPLLSEAAQIQQRAAGDEASNTPSGKKTKRSKARTFEEMTDEEKIPEALRLAYQNLAQISTVFLTRVENAVATLERLKTFRPARSHLLERSKLADLAASLDSSLLDTHKRTLSELIAYTKRLTSLFRAQPFQLISVRFVGQGSD